MALIGRMKTGVTLDGARADFRLLIPEIDAAHPEWKGWANAARISALQEHVSGSMRRPLFVLWAAVALVLVIVCVNLANLLLARESGRSKEIAVRVALGAGRLRLMRQLITESLVLATIGAALGVGIAYAALRYVTHSATFSIPMLQSVRLDGAALAFTALAAVASCLLFAVIPGCGCRSQIPPPHSVPGAAERRTPKATPGSAPRWWWRKLRWLACCCPARDCCCAASCGCSMSTWDSSLRARLPSASIRQATQRSPSGTRFWRKRCGGS